MTPGEKPKKTPTPAPAAQAVAAIIVIFLVCILPFLWFSCESERNRRFIHDESRDMYREMDRQQKQIQHDIDRTFRGW